MADKPQRRYFDRHHLVSVCPVFRRIDAVYADDDGKTWRCPVVGIQTFKTTTHSVETRADVTDDDYADELSWAYLEHTQENITEVGPNHSENFLGYEAEGDTSTDWSQLAREYAAKMKSAVG